MQTTLLQFADVNDAVAGTASKLAKQKLLADYFRVLDEQDLRLAVRFAAGRAFAATDERVLNVGGSIFTDAALALLELDPGDFHELVVRSGEIGEALARAWPATFASSAQPPIELSDVGRAFDDLAATGNQRNKRDLLIQLLSRCTHPREAAYLAKIIFGDLRSGAQEGVLQAAISQAFGKTLPQIQRCQFLVGDLDEAAVLARNDALESAVFRLFHPVPFMLASPQEDAEVVALSLNGRTFWAEDKLDGIRAQVHKDGARLAIYTRTMDRIDESFPEVVKALSQIPGEFLLDGEIVLWSGDKVLPFAHLQKRLGRKTLSPKMLRDNPLIFIAFDLLYLDGQLLMDCPLEHRRRLLQNLAGHGLRTTQPLPISTSTEIQTAFDLARARQNEGIVLKDPASFYSSGRRGQAWLKLKTHLPTLDCVVTAAEHGHGKRRDVLSDYTFAVWDRDPTEPGAVLVNVGKAYSGVTDQEISELTALFHQLSRRQIGRVHLVEPRVVLEIACDQIQKSARHASGYALRFPRIKRIRFDKSAADADRLCRVVELYESTANFGRSSVIPSPVEPTLFDGLAAK